MNYLVILNMLCFVCSVALVIILLSLFDHSVHILALDHYFK